MRLPSLEGRSESVALADGSRTRVGRALAPLIAARPGMTGIYPLADAHEAFAARMLLARSAERTLDVAYYIWRNDCSGGLLFEALREAADRGVRVRLLLDDNNTAGEDDTLAALNAHANIEVRLFNPFVIRRPRFIGYLTDFRRLNRRMHNKSFTVDNQVTVVGGRNIGDEYFGADDDLLFIDLDVMAVGAVVAEVSSDFDRYWASESAYPLERLVLAVDPSRLAAPTVNTAGCDPRVANYLAAIRATACVGELLHGALSLHWAPTRLVSDDPAKGLGRASPEGLLGPRLRQILGDPVVGTELVSPYFVPTDAGAASFESLVRCGVRVQVLTNSLEATDVPAVHAGYAKRRKALVRAGVKLYELRRLAPRERHGRRAGPFGSSKASLHAKTFSVDGARVFVGSFNFDPRSLRLNTEMGVVIECPELAHQIAAAFEREIPARAYEVGLSPEGRLYWLEYRDGALVRHDHEPGSSLWRRALVRMLSWLPIEPLL